MPVAVGIAIRYIIMAAVQLGIWGFLEKYAIPLVDKAMVALMKVYGLSQKEAEDIMANEVVNAFESVGVFAATLRTKLPIKFAEKLGFTSKGFTKRPAVKLPG